MFRCMIGTNFCISDFASDLGQFCCWMNKMDLEVNFSLIVEPLFLCRMFFLEASHNYPEKYTHWTVIKFSFKIKSPPKLPQNLIIKLCNWLIRTISQIRISGHVCAAGCVFRLNRNLLIFSTEKFWILITNQSVSNYAGKF
jgi:hypothetical protein